MLIRIHAEDLPNGQTIAQRTACRTPVTLTRIGTALTVTVKSGRGWVTHDYQLPDTDYDGHPLEQCYITINLATGLPPQLQFVDTNLPF
jgi:hypothetical protein